MSCDCFTQEQLSDQLGLGSRSSLETRLRMTGTECKYCNIGSVRLSRHLLQEICDIGYSPHDIITTFFRVVKLSPELPEFLKLEFIRVRLSPLQLLFC